MPPPTAGNRTGCAVENIVAECERGAIAADEVAADDERLRQPLRLRLDGVFDGQAQAGAVAEKTLEQILLVRRRNDQHIPDSGKHQRRQRVIHHRLVEDRQQLFADASRDRIESRPDPPARMIPFNRCAAVMKREGAGAALTVPRPRRCRL